MPLYLSFYFGSILFFIFSVDKYLKRISNKIEFFFIMLILLMFAGFRYGIATDYWGYYNFFYAHQDVNRIEPGFTYLIKIYKIVFFSNSYNGFVFFIAFLSIGIKYFVFEKTESPFLAIIIYISLFYINIEYNVIRHGLAISFLFLAIKSAQKKKIFVFLIYIGISISIHISSIFFLPVYFLCKKTKSAININTIYIMLLIAVFVRLFLLNFIFNTINTLTASTISGIIEQARRYLKIYSITDISQSTGLIRRFIIIIVFLILNGGKPVNNSFFYLTIMGVFIYILFMGNEILAHRMSLSFDAFITLLYADLKIQRTLKNIFVCIILFSVLFVNYYLPLKRGYSMPYSTYLLKN